MKTLTEDIAAIKAAHAALGERIAKLEAENADLRKDAERMRFLAAHCRSTSEHWGGRWSIVIEGPAPKTHDSEDDFYAAIDAAIAKKESE
jgi:ribosome-associated translation inhibitor RaiA